MSSSSRGRGGRARGGFNDRSRNRDSTPKSIPNVQQVIVGSSVSLVLKADQRTGREVQGIVAELLTRGDHPRGIKVRLQDGRVGRVLRMASGADANSISEVSNEMGSTVARGTFSRPRHGDFRVDEPDGPPSENLSLADYVVVKRKGNSQRNNPGTNQKTSLASEDQDEESEQGAGFRSTTSTCPVCGEFEGDEVAVAHHVNGHFD